MEENALTALGVKLSWVPDRVPVLADFKPRHIGRVVAFDYFTTSDPEDYSSDAVLGTLEGVVGDELVVAGDTFSWSRISNLKIWRKEIKQ